MAWIADAWMLVAAIFLLRLFGQGLMGHTAMVAMARWFVATRGRAVSVAGLGVALGEALLPLTFVALSGVFDWRLLWLHGGSHAPGARPILWALLRQERTPQSFARRPAAPACRAGCGRAASAPPPGLLADAAGASGAGRLEHRLLLPAGPPGRGQGLDARDAGRAVPALHRDQRCVHAARRLAGRPDRQPAPCRLLPAAPLRRLSGLRAWPGARAVGASAWS
jgi:hypothetical protein